mgnify:CR=1 FL=1|jgi:hypothetical protein
MNDLDKLREEQNAKEHKSILEALADMKSEMVHRSEFTPVRNVVYGMMGIIGIFVLQAFLSTVVEAISIIF